MTVAAIVLCGGAAQRFGADKTRETIREIPVLDWVLDALPAPWPVLCVGPVRATRRSGVRWILEDSPGGGPAAAVAAALRRTEAEVVVVLGGDMPFAGQVAADLADRLAAAGEAVDVVAGVDPDRWVQPLLAAYRADRLRRALPAQPDSARLRQVLDRLTVIRVPVPATACLDVDTVPDLERARALAAEQSGPPG